MLAEVIVATAILATAVGAYMAFYLTTRRNLRVSDYNYVAINLLREQMEWRCANNAVHHFSGVYAYTGSGYAETRSEMGNPGPFGNMDIKSMGLVPAAAPNSVVMTYENTPSDLGFDFQASISWQDTTDGPRKYYYLGTAPMAAANDQLQLREGDFTWENK